MKCSVLFLLPFLLTPAAAQEAPLRLYVFDCGKLTVEDPSRFNFTRSELAVLDLSVPCYLVAHPKGTLMWDTGVVPDALFQPGGRPATKQYATAKRPLLAQMTEAGFSPAGITYLALSHAHWDHIGNASAFAGATWLVRPAERDAILSDPPPVRTDPSMFTALRGAKTILIHSDDFDVFGDGSVVIKFTPGHTAGHQVLYVKLAKTGPVVLSGDLYHYPEELKIPRVPAGDVNKEQTLASRAALQEFLKKTGAQLWIQHDLAVVEKQRKAPAYYD
jgi:glyoxylase-like metal-dependent hydrolase (beta-lactamase superfamily II)